MQVPQVTKTDAKPSAKQVYCLLHATRSCAPAQSAGKDRGPMRSRLDARPSIGLAVLWDGSSLLTFYAVPRGWWPCGIPRHAIRACTVRDA